MKKRINLTPLLDIMQTEYGPDSWLVEGLLHTGTRIVLSGQPSSCKTWACLHLALCMTSGKPFLGQFKVPYKRKVLILDKETNQRYLQERYKALEANVDSDILYNFDEDVRLDDEDYIKGIIEIIETEGIGLVILDSLIRYHRGDENDARQMSAVLGNIKRLADTGASIVFTHHHRKESPYSAQSSSSLRGSSDIFAAIDCHIMLEFNKKDDVLVFSHLKSRQGREHEAFSVKIHRNEGGVPIDFEFIGEYDKGKEKRDAAKESIRDLFGTSETKTLPLKEISEQMEGAYSRTILNAALTQLVEEGHLTKTIAKANKALYTLNEEIEEPDSSVEN